MQGYFEGVSGRPPASTAEESAAVRFVVREANRLEAHVLRERLHACVGAGTWTNARAAKWWTTHRSELRSGGGGARVPASGGGAASHLLVTRLAD